MTRGYTEWVTTERISFITNAFGRILYVNRDWPEGKYEKWEKGGSGLINTLRQNAKIGRSFNKEELMLELL